MNVKALFGLNNEDPSLVSAALLIAAVTSVIAASAFSATRDAGMWTFLGMVIAINVVAGLAIVLLDLAVRRR